MKENNFRLPNAVKPLNYELFFDIDLTNFSFYGNEKIDLKIEPNKEYYFKLLRFKCKKC
jgi:hypothetical protein